MYHPTTRVLTILELLQSYGSMSGPEMAERLEVEQRTVRRYITMLQDMGIPIETTRGPGGGYHLRRGFKLPPLMLTDDEALAITLSLIAARRRGVPADPAMIEGALAKTEDLNLAARYLILLGCPFVIRRPPELRTAVLAVANEAIAMAQG